MADMEESIEDALLFALDDLREENFKRFKYKLGFLKWEGKAHIPQGKLEDANTMDTVQLLLEAYGMEGAREVAIHVLKEINLRDSATRLQTWKYNDCKKNYKRHLRETFWPILELGSNHGSTVGLPQRYTELLLVRNPQRPETAHELLGAEKKHRKMEVDQEGGCQKLGLEDLFDSAAEKKSSRTVILVGPAGVGKTTAMRKLMLDWASGQFWQAKFEYAFYLSCRALNVGSTKAMSLVDLMLSGCPPGTLLAEDILMNQDSLLLILDGFDELKHQDLPSGTQSASNPHEKQAAASLVTGLLRKKLLAPCHLIVTTRPVALGSLLPCLRSPQFVEVLGFQPAQREEYFHRFFQNKEEATRAFELVRINETLFRVCFLPVVCWVICSVLSGGLQKQPLKDIPEMATFTDVYLGLLDFLGCPSRLSDLKGLCGLAKDGVLRQTMVYNEEELKAHGLEPFSASRRLLPQDVHLPGICQFIHLGFQEFFAALSYLLDSDREAGTSSKDLKEVFGTKKAHSCNDRMLVRFLFGLSNTKRQSILQKTWGYPLTSRIRLCQEFLSWVEQEARCQAFRSGEPLLELCHCLYEMHDSQFAQSVMGHIYNIDLRDHLLTKLDLAALSFGLSASDSLRSLRLSSCKLGLKELEQLSPGLLKSSEIQLHLCSLTAAACKDLASVLETSDSLQDLGLGDNRLGDEGVRQLCAALRKPHCKLQKFSVSMRGLNQNTRRKLESVLTKHPQMSLISYYPPDFPAFPSHEKYMKVNMFLITTEMPET
nr:NACHT, LRR and PYD domains-containing protein 3-like isoform X1 [Pogona vitticeps]XP_020652123.1 NACHT, LRR and PYD domains-containing protein 3-like isoform X1 [Pogona vitticeps]XP_020652124.1 NACHT, LRR and PYD domains-containing protein 3-like isoform X1 [Pogona vitticeps]